MAINVTANVTPIAVIQVKPGIGDVVWHLPFIRAIAAAAPERQVTFFAPPTSAATDLLAAERCVAATVYFEHAGSELQRGINLLRLVARAGRPGNWRRCSGGHRLFARLSSLQGKLIYRGDY